MNLRTLANFIQLQRDNKKPAILLLGAGCSISSGCPSAKKLTEKLINDNGLNLDPKENTLQDVEKVLDKAIFNLSVDKHLQGSTPSQGYWFLADLIRKGYFELIFTTNYDTCLEKTLGKIMEYDEFRVCIRGDVDDDRINEIIRQPAPKVKIIKLHGDCQSRNIKIRLEELWYLKESLNKTLEEKIKENGIIIIGYSMHDVSILDTLPRDLNKNTWYIDIQQPDVLTKSVLDHRLIKDSHIVTGDAANFDNFFGSLAILLGEKEQEQCEKLKKLKRQLDDRTLSEELFAACKIEVDRKALSDLLSKLVNEIDRCLASINNLVFIHDPDAPGGTEVLKVLQLDHKEWLAKKKSIILEVSGRGEKILKREAKDFLDDRWKPVNITEVIDPDDRRFLLIDSVSFTGGTIKKARARLVEALGEKIDVGAAFIYISKMLEKQIEENSTEKTIGIKKCNFLKIKTIDSHQILFPWGWTSSTKEINLKGEKTSHFDIINEFIPNRYFSFLPRPWGNIFSMVDNENVSIKILYIDPHEKTSQHKHYLRDEIFYILDEHIILQIWDENILLRRGISFRVPAGVTHRLIGLDIPCRVLEISYNYNNQVEDIKRYDDSYGRTHKKGDV